MTRANDFTPATKRKARERSDGICEVHLISDDLRKCWYRALPLVCGRKAEEVDHIIPETCGGSRELSNAAHLCKPCHAIKTVTDNKMAKKANRLQGLTGQTKRRNEKGSQIQSRGFDNRYRKKLDGTVERRGAS